MGILEKLTFEVKCGPAVAELDKSLCLPFISAKEVIENKKNHIALFHPHEPMYVRHPDSPLNAFEGDEELYNEWLNS